MVYIKGKGSTPQQLAYARRIFGGKGTSKQEIALDCGYSPNVSRSIKTHIENTKGFNNAMTALAADSNNLALAAMHEFKARGFEGFSNKELVGALNAIGNAWAKFNTIPEAKEKKPSNNKLRTVILQQVENQIIASDTEGAPKLTQEPPPEVIEVVEAVDDPMDF